MTTTDRIYTLANALTGAAASQVRDREGLRILCVRYAEQDRTLALPGAETLLPHVAADKQKPSNINPSCH